MCAVIHAFEKGRCASAFHKWSWPRTGSRLIHEQTRPLTLIYTFRTSNVSISITRQKTHMGDLCSDTCPVLRERVPGPRHNNYTNRSLQLFPIIRSRISRAKLKIYYHHPSQEEGSWSWEVVFQLNALLVPPKRGGISFGIHALSSDMHWLVLEAMTSFQASLPVRSEEMALRECQGSSSLHLRHQMDPGTEFIR